MTLDDEKRFAYPAYKTTIKYGITIIEIEGKSEYYAEEEVRTPAAREHYRFSRPAPWTTWLPQHVGWFLNSRFRYKAFDTKRCGLVIE